MRIPLSCLRGCASVAGSALVLFACSSTPTPPTGGGGASINVTPTPANVLTCDTLQLTETGGTGTGSWSVSPSGAGTVSAGGLYSAPSVAPSSPAVAVTYTAGGASGSAQLQVAAAFPAAPVPVPIHAGAEVTTHSPSEHELTANGAQIYVGLVASGSAGSGSVETDIFASADNGKTFTGPTVYTTGDLACATIAVDAGDPSVVYLVYLADLGSSTTMRLAVSTDGAKTFATEYELAADGSNLGSFSCPDVISPSAGHVIVTGYSALVPDGSKDHLATFVSANQGVGIGPATQPGVVSSNGTCDCETGNDTSVTAIEAACDIYSNGGSGGPRLVTNGKGEACTVFQYGSCSDASRAYNIAVRCSQDSGATWSGSTLLGVPATDNSVVPTGALSPGGKLAVAWVGDVAADAGGGSATFVAVSSDGGKTFSAPKAYPNDVVTGATAPVVVWENDTVLWLAQVTTDNAKNLYIDKTCDDGATWSGALLQGTGGYVADSVILTKSGVIAVGDLPSAITTFPLGP